MTYENVTLKYSSVMTTVITSSTGLTVYDNIEDIYHDTNIRNRVICRVDCVKLLTHFFTKETIEEHRDTIFNLACKVTEDAEVVSSVVTYLFENDNNFKEFLRELKVSDARDMSFGDKIITTLADSLKQISETIYSYFLSSNPFVLAFSNGYVYLSFKDEEGAIRVPNHIELEVVSYAKNWDYSIERV